MLYTLNNTINTIIKQFGYTPKLKNFFILWKNIENLKNSDIYPDINIFRNVDIAGLAYIRGVIRRSDNNTT